METVTTIARVAVGPLLDVISSPGEKQHALYLTSALAIAAAAYLSRSRRPTAAGLLAFLLPRRIFLHPSAIADYKLWLLNNLALVLLLPTVAALSGLSFGVTLLGLRHAAGMDGMGLSAGPLAVVIGTAVGMLAIDAALFWAHYLQHKVPWLWEFHKVHHSAQVLTPFTVFRMHPVDLVLNFSTGGVLGGVGAALIVFLFGARCELTLFGVNAVEILFFFAGYHLRHSHVWLMFPGWIGRHISSPALHLIHHSTDPKHWDKNMAQMFTFWDRLAGTLYLPTRREAIRFGLGNGEDHEFATLADLYIGPFRKLAGTASARPAGDGDNASARAQRARK